MLEGEAKRDYQRRYMREYMRNRRGVKTQLRPNVKTQDIPLYNPMTHRPGDRVMVWKGRKLVEVVIPELDSEGNPMPSYT